ncbi:MAG: hypothetical protein ACUVXI_09800 [bacterium]
MRKLLVTLLVVGFVVGLSGLVFAELTTELDLRVNFGGLLSDETKIGDMTIKAKRDLNFNTGGQNTDGWDGTSQDGNISYLQLLLKGSESGMGGTTVAAEAKMRIKHELDAAGAIKDVAISDEGSNVSVSNILGMAKIVAYPIDNDVTSQLKGVNTADKPGVDFSVTTAGVTAGVDVNTTLGAKNAQGTQVSNATVKLYGGYTVENVFSANASFGIKDLADTMPDTKGKPLLKQWTAIGADFKYLGLPMVDPSIDLGFKLEPGAFAVKPAVAFKSGQDLGGSASILIGSPTYGWASKTDIQGGLKPGKVYIWDWESDPVAQYDKKGDAIGGYIGEGASFAILTDLDVNYALAALGVTPGAKLAYYIKPLATGTGTTGDAASKAVSMTQMRVQPYAKVAVSPHVTLTPAFAYVSLSSPEKKKEELEDAAGTKRTVDWPKFSRTVVAYNVLLEAKF